MAGINYYEMQETIQTILKTDITDFVHVGIEEEVVFGIDNMPAAYIYLDRRDAPPDIQVVASGRVTKYNVRFPVWVYAYSLESIAESAKLRDSLIARSEVAFMKKDNRALLTDGPLWLEGGAFQSAKNADEGGFLMGAEIIVVVQATSTVD